MPALVSTCGAKTICGASSRIAATTSSIGAGAKGATGSLPVWRAFITVTSPPKAPASKICDQRNENHPLRTTSALAPWPNWRATASMPKVPPPGTSATPSAP